MQRETAYRTDIPEEAEERVTSTYPDGARERVEYYLQEELVGLRYFHPMGELSYEASFHAGVPHGRHYRWDIPGRLLSMEPWEAGVPHGTAYQWADDGRLIGAYSMERGTGIDLWWQECGGPPTLAEVLYKRDGLPHGFEWWLNADQRSVHTERHWWNGRLHGIEREWNARRRLRRGFPAYWVDGDRVTRRQYLKSAAGDPNLPPLRMEEDQPQRQFPPEVARHLFSKDAEADFPAES